MHLKKFFREWRMVRKNRKNYRLAFGKIFEVADDPFSFVLIPTIVYKPWHQLLCDSEWDRMFVVVWLNFGISFGKLVRIKENDWA